MAVYIVWKETTQEFAGRTPDKYGTWTPDFRAVTKTRKVLYSTDATPAMVARAKAYVADPEECSFPGARVCVTSE